VPNADGHDLGGRPFVAVVRDAKAVTDYGFVFVDLEGSSAALRARLKTNVAYRALLKCLTGS
jgi:hypothetical protein